MSQIDDDRTAEATRIAQQHSYITSSLNFLIHPIIEHHIKDDTGPIRIAEISPEPQFQSETDLKWPKCPLEIVPIPLKDLLQPETTPATVQNSKGTFHIVAVRLIHLIIRHSHWDTAVQNLISLLRPGGWLQWTDWDPRTARIAGVKAGAEDKALRNLLQRFSDLLRERQVGTTYRISSSMRDAGLVEDDSDMYPLVPDVALTRNIAHEAIRQLEVAGNSGDEEIGRLRREVDDEIEAGNSLIWYDLWCHIARKPKQK